MNEIPPLTQNLFNRANLLTNDEAAAYIGVAPQTLTIWRCVKRYAIPYIKVGSRIRYRREDLDTWLASRTVGTQAATAA